MIAEQQPATESATPAAQEPSTPHDALEATRATILEKISTQLEPKAEAKPPEQPKAAPTPDEERAERLARAVAADNRTRAEAARLAAARKAHEEEQAAFREERERLAAVAAKAAEVDRLMADGKPRLAMSKMLGRKVTDAEWETMLSDRLRRWSSERLQNVKSGPRANVQRRKHGRRKSGTRTIRPDWKLPRAHTWQRSARPTIRTSTRR
jgi:hypothetical protein